MPVDLKKLIEDTHASLGGNSGQTLQIESLGLETFNKQKAFVINRLGRLVYSLYREHPESPNLYKIGFALRVYLELISESKGPKFFKFKEEFLSGFNDPKHESVKFEEFQRSKASELK